MSRVDFLGSDLPDEFADLRLPAALDARRKRLLERREQGERSSPAEREEADGLVALAEMLSRLRLDAEARSKIDAAEADTAGSSSGLTTSDAAGRITADESDRDEVWDEILRNLGVGPDGGPPGP